MHQPMACHQCRFHIPESCDRHSRYLHLIDLGMNVTILPDVLDLKVVIVSRTKESLLVKV